MFKNENLAGLSLPGCTSRRLVSIDLMSILGGVPVFILPLILLSIVRAAIFLNYLFARATAAILILGAHTVLKMGYPAQLPGYPVLAALVLVAGIIGIVLSAKPYWLRDWFRLSFRNPAVRWGSAAYFLILCAMSCYCAVEA